MIVLANDDGKKMVERDSLDSFLEEYVYVTGVELADSSPMDPYGTVQLIGVKPKRWRGVHPHRFYGRKPYG